MTEYINRQAVLDLFDGSKWQGQICIDEVKEIPEADVAPVVHGTWVDSDIPGSMLSKCTVCGFRCGSYTFNFCPNCGEKMDKEADDAQ